MKSEEVKEASVVGGADDDSLDEVVLLEVDDEEVVDSGEEDDDEGDAEVRLVSLVNSSDCIADSSCCSVKDEGVVSEDDVAILEDVGSEVGAEDSVCEKTSNDSVVNTSDSV